jgi:hypothetical protein
VSFKKKVWEELGGYAEWLPRGRGEDVHFFLRAQKGGIISSTCTVLSANSKPAANLFAYFNDYFQKRLVDGL